MRRAIIYTCLIGWLVIFCLTINFFESLAMFLLFGIVPWSHASLSARDMLAFYYLTTSLVVFIVIRKQFKNLLANTPTTQPQAQA